MTTEEAILELLTVPALADSGAVSRLKCGEIADAATYLIEDIHDLGIVISAVHKGALLEGVREYAHGDKELYDAYAALLEMHG
nr:hypothetical protein [Corynebacterium lactis]